MTIYKVVRGNSYTNNAEEVFFTSRDKAIGYIIGRYAEAKKKPYGRVRQADWYNGAFCYDVDELLNIKNWNKYNYLMNGEFFYINSIKVL